MDARTQSRKVVWPALTVLLVIMLLAVAGVIYPEFRPTEILVRPDQFSHAVIIYVLTLLAALALPRLPHWVIVLTFAALAIGLEVAQLVGVVKGSAQLSDLSAGLVGVIAAILPIAVVRARRRLARDREA